MTKVLLMWSQIVLAGAVAFGSATDLRADDPSGVGVRSWRYVLLPGSLLVDDCPTCGRPLITVALRGTFDLRLVEESPLAATYAWDRIDWATPTPGGKAYATVGEGRYQVGGEVALRQELTLDVVIDSGWTNRRCGFAITNLLGQAVQRLWPMIAVAVDQTNGLPTQQYRLEIVAAPLQELWFSTRQGFHAGIGQTRTNWISPGDLLSISGRVVKRNDELTRKLGIMPVVPDLGLSATDVLPGGEIAFAVEWNQFSETLGRLEAGDVLSDRGRILQRNAELVRAFGPEPPPVNEGLDALQVLPDGELYFSVTNAFFSERLGRLIAAGDLLSSRGALVKSQAELLGRFHPAEPEKDAGLDAVWVWPSGEIWFSTERGFYGQHFEFYSPGSVLSDQGHVVYENLQLLESFRPLEELADFGLDALFVVTDALPPSPPPEIVSVSSAPGPGDLELNWKGAGRVFRVERSNELLTAWLPISPIQTDLSFTDRTQGQDRAFYVVRQW